MKNWRVSPEQEGVVRYVDTYWYLEKEAGDPGGCFPKLNPDPTAHLILAPKGQRYRYDLEEQSKRGNGSHWIFPHRQTFVMDHSNAFKVLGVKFKVGVPYVLGIEPSQPIVDDIHETNLEELIGSEKLLPDELLDVARESSRKCSSLLDEVLSSLLHRRLEDHHFELVQRAHQMLEQTPVSEMGEALFCSQRTIERSFLKVTGLTLKQCQSMDRFERMLEYLQELKAYDNGDSRVDWADVACLFGFSDQPHLIRFLKRTIQETPSKYEKKRNLAIDIYGDLSED